MPLAHQTMLLAMLLVGPDSGKYIWCGKEEQIATGGLQHQRMISKTDTCSE
jgi:hypothetical protein